MKKIVKGQKIVLLVGPKDLRGKVFDVSSIVGDRVILSGYPQVKKAKKITENNSQNFVFVDRLIHVSNVMPYDSSSNVRSRIGVRFVDDKKEKFYKKTGNKV